MSQWRAPAPGDIVWCYFPELPHRHPGPKPWPALVQAVEVREDGVVVTVAYGTTQGLNRLYSGEFAIRKQQHPDAYASAGLSYDTKFDFRKTIELPWTGEFFAVPPNAPHGQHPKLGVLHASLMRQVQAAHGACD